MKKFKKILGVILSMLLLTAYISGCSNTNTGNSSSGDFTQIRVWTGDTGSRLIYEQAVSEFNETIGKKQGIQIKYEAKENLAETLTVALQTHQAPEMFMGGVLAEYAEQGYITALDDLAGGSELIEKYSDLLTEEKHTYKGKTYSVPYASDTYGLIYNKDLFKAAGIVDENGEATPPKTFAQLREYAKKLTDPQKGNYGIAFPMKWGGMFSKDFMSAAASSSGINGYDYKTGMYDYSCLKDILDTVMAIKADKSYMPGAESLDNDPARSRFAEGNIGMKFAVSWDVGVLNKQFPAKCDWGVAPLPVADENEKYYQDMNVNSGLKISSEAVEKIGAEKIMIAYNYMVSEDMQKRVFELGGALPVVASVINDVDSENLPKGWKEFAQMLEISKLRPIQIPSDISGEVAVNQDFVNNVWSGKKTVDKMIADANRIYNEGVEKYFSIHPDAKKEDYIVSDYDMRR